MVKNINKLEEDPYCKLELRSEYIKKLNRIKKEKTSSFNSIEELHNYIQSKCKDKI